jgi:cyclic pyranopterin phosphate synthase
MVAMKDVNEADIETMVGFCIENGFILRLIEAMPMGDSGRNTRFLDLQPVLEQLRQRFGLLPQHSEMGGGPARYWRSTDGALPWA